MEATLHLPALADVLELATELENGSAPDQLARRKSHAAGIAELERSGVPMNAKHPLLASVEKIDGDLKDVKTEAAEKHKAVQAAEQKVAAATTAGETIGTAHPAFVELEAAGAAYGEVADKVTDMETAKATLIARMADAGITPATHSDGSGDRERNAYLAELREAGLIPNTARAQTPGQRIAQSDEYKAAVDSGALQRRQVGNVALGEAMDREELMAALITGADPGSAGAFVTPDRQGYYPLPLRPLTVLDLITIGQTDSDLVEYVRMLAITNAAAETPEAITAAPIDGTTVTAVQGGRKPESGMTFDIEQVGVSTIAHWVPATKRSLADAGQLRTYIDGALRWGLGDRLERQVVAGNGVGDNILGILNQPGINSVATADVPAGYNAADRIMRAITLNRVDGFQTTGILLNPFDAEGIWLSREDGATGPYMFGGPAQVGARTLWGRPTAESPAVPQGTAVVGNLAAYIFWLREGAQIMASDSHEDFFTRNLVAILAEMRGAGGLPTPAAVAEVELPAAA